MRRRPFVPCACGGCPAHWGRCRAWADASQPGLSLLLKPGAVSSPGCVECVRAWHGEAGARRQQGGTSAA